MSSVRGIAWIGAALVAVAMQAISAGAALAQPYPNRPIRLIVPAPVGGATDSVARVFATGLAERLGANVVVENRGGASGAIGVEAVARAAPDGYTLLFTGQDVSILPLLRKKVPYDPDKDLTPIAKVGDMYLLIGARNDFPAQSLQDVIAMAKAKPGQVKFASGGNGTLLHFAGEMLKQQAGIDLLHIPYKGGGPALAGMMSGDTELIVSALNLQKNVESGQIRALAVTKPTRSTIMPNVPTVAESGVSGFVADAWMAVFAPAGLPEPIAARLSAESVALAASPAFRQRLALAGAEGTPVGRDAMPQFLQSYTQRWRDVVERANIKLED